MIVLSASLDVMVTDGVRIEFTVVVTVVEVAVEPVIQVSELVITTFTTSLLVSEAVV